MGLEEYCEAALSKEEEILVLTAGFMTYTLRTDISGDALSSTILVLMLHP